ncbi:MAG TPA: ArsA family ATPase [Candidatus Limnocylindrales bacterium]|nr:ArsA family ATPase [Candidatus Limnocylindrales bacterium]
MTRIIVYTGKGGVGKTSIAAATAVRCAERGYRTIVLSTDIAHSLGDAFDRPLGAEPEPLAPGLWGHEPDVFLNIQRYWGTIQAYVAELFSWRGLDEVMAEEMTVLPGMDELGSLLWIADHHDSGRYDVIVVDAAPTGETLRLLALPEAARWWVERIAPLGRRITRLGGPLLQRAIGVPMPDEDVYDAAERLLRRLDHVHRLMADPDTSSVRLVLNLERTAISEAQRSFTYFHMFGYPTDLVICNRVLPPGVGAFFDAWRTAQTEYLPLVEQAFAPVPVHSVPHLEHEIVGDAPLRELANGVFGEGDPTTFFYRGRPYSIHREDGRFVIALELPLTAKEDVSLSRNGDELTVHVGTWRRTLVLPRILVGAPALGARMEDGRLTVRFAAPDRMAAGGSRGG